MIEPEPIDFATDGKEYLGMVDLTADSVQHTEPQRDSTVAAQVKQKIQRQAQQWVQRTGQLLGKITPVDVVAREPNDRLDPFAGFRQQLPRLGKQVFGSRFGTAHSIAQRVLPAPVLQQAADHLFLRVASIAEHLGTSDEVLNEAGVLSYADLADLPLAQADQVADVMINRNRVLAAVQGGLSGTLGLWGAVIDLPLVLILSLRTIYQTAAAYGVDLNSPAGRDRVFDVLASVSLEAMAEKQAVLLAIASVRQLVEANDLHGLQRMVGSGNKPDLFQKLANDLSSTVNVQLSPALLAKIAPLAQGAASGLYNARILNSVAHAAQQAFRPSAEAAAAQTAQGLLTHAATPNDAPAVASEPSSLDDATQAQLAAFRADVQADLAAEAPTEAKTEAKTETLTEASTETKTEIETVKKAPRKRTVRAKKPLDGAIETDNQPE